MDFFISNAYAQGAAQGGSLGSMLLPMVVIFGAFYFLLIRTQQKRQKAHTELVGALAKGDEVLTAGGVLGKVKQSATITQRLRLRITSKSKFKNRQLPMLYRRVRSTLPEPCE